MPLVVIQVRTACSFISLHMKKQKKKFLFSISSFIQGQCHDSAVFGACDLYSKTEDHFSAGEYIIANSAYPVTPHCVPVIQGSQLTQDQLDFNRCIAHVHTVNEHTIGILKNQWQILTHLPNRIQPKKLHAEHAHAMNTGK